MNKKEHINKLIEEAIDSVNNANRAVPLPFLLTRINARLNKAKENGWEKAGSFIGRPLIAIPALILMVLLNVLVIINNKADPFETAIEQPGQAPADEFSYTVSALYDFENTEP